MPQQSLQQMLCALRAFLVEELGYHPFQLQVFFTELKEPTCLPFPSEHIVASGFQHGGESVSTPDEPFVLTPFQEAIMEALEGTAMRTRALGAAVGDQSRLYKAGGLVELRERGMVKHHPRLGFYRPDAPPEQLRGQEGGSAGRNG